MQFLITGLLVFTFINAFAQPAPVLEWQRTYGSAYGEYPGTILETFDGGYIISGYSAGDDGDVMGHHGNPTVADIWVIKIDKTGKIEWQKSYGGSDSDAGAYIIQTPDGGFILAGSAGSRDCNITGNHGGLDYWILRLDTKGEVLWQKMYGGSLEDYVRAITLTNDGGYYVAGQTQSNDGDVSGNHGLLDFWIIKINANGNLLWQKTLGGSDYDNARGIQATPDGGCVAVGNTYSTNGNVTGNHGAGDYWVTRLDPQGNLQWQKTLGGSMTDIAACIQLAPNDGFIVSGFSNSFDGDVSGGHGGYDAWIVRLNNAGNIIWQRSYGGSQNETANDIRNTGDGFVFTGMSASNDGDINCNAGLFDVFVAKIDYNGQPEWQRTWGGVGYDEGACIQPLADGSFIVLGYTESADVPGHHQPASNADGRSDYWVIKLSPPLATVPAPVVTIDPASAIVCGGYPAIISASVLYGGVNPVYQWIKNGQLVGVNNPRYTDNNLSANDQLSCIVRHGNICENNALQGTDAVTIKLKGNLPNPSMTIAADNTSTCDCSTITIKATVTNPGGSPRYVWFINGVNVNIDAPTLISSKLADGYEIRCLYFDNTNCLAADSVFSNTIKFGGSSNPRSVTIAADNDTICKGTAVNFTANPINAGTSLVYQWQVNNVNAGTNSSVFTSNTLSDGDEVTCFVRSDPAMSCAPAGSAFSNRIQMKVLGSAAPAVSIAASAETICTGSAVNFIATATNAGTNVSYQWKLNGANVGGNDKNYSNASLVDNDVISCTITADPQFACALANQASSQNITMTVNTGEPASVKISADRASACAGESIIFNAEAQHAGSNPGFEWILNGNMVSNQSPVYNNNHMQNGDRLFCRLVPGTGACGLGADTSNLIVAVINDTPFVRISPADTTTGPGKQFHLMTTVSGNINSFEWSPANKLIDPLSLSPQTTVINENTPYQLSVENDKGCKGIATALIKVFTQLFMPTAFSPNNDGVNDVFRIPPAHAVTLKEFSVYNRWGVPVFSTKNILAGWDGTVRGKKQDTGAYVYYVKALVNGKEIFLKGNFLLVR
jgi:gliding motility-associated-like protein